MYFLNKIERNSNKVNTVTMQLLRRYFIHGPECVWFWNIQLRNIVIMIMNDNLFTDLTVGYLNKIVLINKCLPQQTVLKSLLELGR